MGGAQGNGHDIVIEVSGLVGRADWRRFIFSCHGGLVRRFAYVKNNRVRGSGDVSDNAHPRR